MPEAVDFSYLRLILACSVVAGLLAAMAFILKYVAAQGIVLPRGKKPARRLRIVESLMIDTKRRLVIVRCDGREHLLLLNAERDMVVDANLPPASDPDSAP